MHRNSLMPALTVMALLFGSAVLNAEALRLDPRNPHYLLFRGKPTIFIGSSEHYGSVMNRDFDYVRYLDTLQTNYLNVTRVFSGQYHERPGKFGVLPSAGFPDFEIVGNTLAPEANSYVAPWPRTQEAGALDGGNKFDLSRWNPEYFQRLRDFVLQADRRGIVVEVSLFSPYDADVVGNRFWDISPWNAKNNVNGIGSIRASEALSLKHKHLVEIQDELVKKIVEELHEYDNVYYEICNEPEGEVPLDWQRHIADTIQSAEARYPSKHLIAQEITYGGRKAEERLVQASVIAFHNSEGKAVALNYELNIPIIHNETIFDFSDTANRVAAWRFLLSGGAMYLGVDYSFAVGHEDGTYVAPPGGAGGGSRALRQQLQMLHHFIDELPYPRMSPQPSIIQSGLTPNAHAYALGEPGSTYAIYIYHGHSDPIKGITVDETSHQLSLTLRLPPGRYTAKWLDPKTGTVKRADAFVGGARSVLQSSPAYSEDIALLICREQDR